MTPAHNAPQDDEVGVVERLRAAGDPLSTEAADAIDALRAMIDPEFTFRDLEAHVRDGHLELNITGSKEGGDPAIRLLGAVMLNILLGPDEEMPPNYRMVEWSLRFPGDSDYYRICAELVKPGGKSSHEIRREMEAVDA